MVGNRRHPEAQIDSAASIELALFDALNPDTPLASFSAQKERVGLIAAYLFCG